MQRVLLLGVVVVTGCQSQSPYAVVGPATVPAPNTAQAPPYYPPPPDGAAPAATASTRPSVSAESGIVAAPAAPTLAMDAADREPLRIVENPSPTRTAAAPARPSGAGSKQPPSSPGTGHPAPTGAVPAPAIAPAPQSSYVPGGLPPAVTRLRGFEADAPNRSGVVPAGYQQPAARFSETPPGGQQWRAR